MDIATAKALSNKLQISIDCIVREEYEILLLKEIFESKYGTKLVFKGGTSLRLAYGSPRYSEDLDFTMLEEFGANSFIEFLKNVANKYKENIAIEAEIEKFYTIFAIVKVRENFLNRDFSIKIEISKRKGKWIKEKDFTPHHNAPFVRTRVHNKTRSETSKCPDRKVVGAGFTDKVIKSEVSPLTVLARVATLLSILREKKDALKHRKAARDIFDYWYINQLLRKEAKIDLSGYDKMLVKSELHRLLAKPYWRVVDSWLE